MSDAVVLAGHGTVESLDDLPVFLRNIRQGRAPSDELVHEVRRRYEAIGGASPLLRISNSAARKLEQRLGMPVRVAMRLFHPYPKDVLTELAKHDVEHVAVVALAQCSASIYGEAVKKAAEELAASGGPAVRVSFGPNWGDEPLLARAFAKRVREALREVPESAGGAHVLFSAHSLPMIALEHGDPYEACMRQTAALVAAELGRDGGSVPSWSMCFQSQGMSSGPGGRPMAWLGPDLRSSLEAEKGRGRTHVVVAPIGFLADHVEILYDLDIEAKGWASELGLELSRTRSLNDDDDFIEVLEALVRPLLVP